MYLSNIKLWNFRRYGSTEDLTLSDANFLEKPNLNLKFTKGLNVLIGANDSWKTAILDAIKLVLRTNSYERISVKEDDFYWKATKFRIELMFENLDIKFSRFFVEHLTVEWEWDAIKEKLILVLEVSRNGERIFSSDVKAWINWELGVLSAEQRDLLYVTYLKPLRDVQSEFVPKKNSRLSKILEWHSVFKWKWEEHELYQLLEAFDKQIEDYFSGTWIWTTDWKKIKSAIDSYVCKFLDNTDESSFSVWKDAKLKDVLEKLTLKLKDNINPWLWSLNRLFIASELLHLQRENHDGLNLWLIEEIEAHIHPQAQMKVIETLQSEVENNWVQLILTTHSPNLASKVKLENLIICGSYEKNWNVFPWAFPMWKEYTWLWEENYRFLERFLDVTKSNLFFSEWVILVEWWAEEIILPTFARLLKKLGVIKLDLTESQTEIVNVWSDTFFRYAKIFERKGEPYLNKKIAIITDMDLRPDEYKNNPNIQKQLEWIIKEEEINSILKKNNILTWFNDDEVKIERENKNINKQWIKTFLTDDENWTLEYSLWLFPKFQYFLLEAVKKSIVDMRKDTNTTYSRWEETKSIDPPEWFRVEEWSQEEETVEKITWDDKEIAFTIYNDIMLKKQVSKSVVAQYFSEFLEDEIDKIKLNADWSIENNWNIFKKENFDSESSVSYLINAIKYATNQE